MFYRHVDRVPCRVTVFARDSRAQSRLDRRPASLFGFYLRNRAQGGALAGSESDMRAMPFLSRFMLCSLGCSTETSGFVARGLMIRFAPPTRVQGDVLPIDDAWFAGAELVVVRTTREGSVQRELDIFNFPLP